MNIGILASGNGTNFEAIAKAIERGYVKACLKILITDKKNAFALVRAKHHKIKSMFLNPKGFVSRLEFDDELTKILKEEKIDLVILAGFMRILTPNFVKSFKNKILNIHPAILPAFKGERSIERAFRYGCKIAGVTVHFVDENVDNGPIVLQEAVMIKEGISLAALEKTIHQVEHRLYPLAIKLYTERKLKIRGRHVKIK